MPSCLVGFIVRASEHVSFDAATRIGWLLDAPLLEIRAGLTLSLSVGRN